MTIQGFTERPLEVHSLQVNVSSRAEAAVITKGRTGLTLE